MPTIRNNSAVRLEFASGFLVHTNLCGGKRSWPVLYDAYGSERLDGEQTVFGDLLRHD